MSLHSIIHGCYRNQGYTFMQVTLLHKHLKCCLAVLYKKQSFPVAFVTTVPLTERSKSSFQVLPRRRKMIRSSVPDCVTRLRQRLIYELIHHCVQATSLTGDLFFNQYCSARLIIFDSCRLVRMLGLNLVPFKLSTIFFAIYIFG